LVKAGGAGGVARRCAGEGAPDDAAPVKMGEFTPQFIAPEESAPIGEKPMPAAKADAGPRWFRRRRPEA